MGAIKNVGFEAISNIIKERSINGEFKNLSDFINRVNHKDINKLQMEGLVQAGAFDVLNKNRCSLFESIPNIISKSKNLHENKSANQINLFVDHETEDFHLLNKNNNWESDIKLSREFDTLGFYISDHPLNQFKKIFAQFNIINFVDFESNKDILSSNIACTVLKVQEKKTQKGNSYGIIKFSDLTSVFELFVFSDIFEINRDLIKAGNSLMLTLIKSFTDSTKSQKRINVKKILSLKEIANKPIRNITFQFNDINEIKKLKGLGNTIGETEVKIVIKKSQEIIKLQLKNRRKIDNNLLNSLKLIENTVKE